MSTAPQKPPRPSKAKVALQQKNANSHITASTADSAAVVTNIDVSRTISSNEINSCEKESLKASNSSVDSDSFTCSTPNPPSTAVSMRAGLATRDSPDTSDAVSLDLSVGYATVDDIKTMISEATPHINRSLSTPCKPQIKPKPQMPGVSEKPNSICAMSENDLKITNKVSDSTLNNSKDAERNNSCSNPKPVICSPKKRAPAVPNTPNTSALDSKESKPETAPKVMPIYSTIDKSKKKASSSCKDNEFHLPGLDSTGCHVLEGIVEEPSDKVENNSSLTDVSISPTHGGSKQANKAPPKKPPRTFAHSEYLHSKTLKEELKKLEREMKSEDGQVCNAETMGKKDRSPEKSKSALEVQADRNFIASVNSSEDGIADSCQNSNENISNAESAGDRNLAKTDDDNASLNKTTKSSAVSSGGSVTGNTVSGENVSSGKTEQSDASKMISGSSTNSGSGTPSSNLVDKVSPTDRSATPDRNITSLSAAGTNDALQHRNTTDKLLAPPRPPRPAVYALESDLPFKRNAAGSRMSERSKTNEPSEPFKRNAPGVRMSERIGMSDQKAHTIMRTRSVAKDTDVRKGEWGNESNEAGVYATISECVPSPKTSTRKKVQVEGVEGGADQVPELQTSSRSVRGGDGSATLPVGTKLLASVKRHNSEATNNTYRNRMVAHNQVMSSYSILRQNLVLLDSGETELLPDEEEDKDSRMQTRHQRVKLKHVSSVKESTGKSVDHYSTIVRRPQRQPISSSSQGQPRNNPQSTQQSQADSSIGLRMAERALIVALRPTSILCSASGCSEPTNRFQPYILRDLASASVNQSSAEKTQPTDQLIDLSDIEMLCFPDADLWRPVTLYKGDSLTFQLIEEDGSRRYGYCRRYLPGGTSSELNRLPEAFCALSRVAMSQADVERLLCLAEEKLCLQTEVLSASDQTITAEQLLGLLQQLQLQQNLNTIRSSAMMADRRQTLKNAKLGDGTLNRTYIESLVGESWSNSNLLVKIFSNLILERNVILVSSNVGILSHSCQAVMSLLDPFEWQHDYVSVLPVQMIDKFFCQSQQSIQTDNQSQNEFNSLSQACRLSRSSLPYMVGILSSAYAQLVQRDGFDSLQALIVDIESGSILRCYGDEDHVLPCKLKKALLSSLAMDPDTGVEVRKFVVREAFMRFFVETCGHFSEYICTQQDGQAVFEREAFIKAVCSPNIRLFLEWFTYTRMFDVFITEELGGSKHSMFELSVIEYRKEMAELSSSLKHNVLQVGKKIKDLFVESGDKVKKRIERTVFI